MAPTQQVYDTLLSARVWLDDEHHWCQQDWGSIVRGRTCLVGAIRGLAPSSAAVNEAWNELRSIVAIDSDDGVLGFNDAPGTTHRDVLNLLDTALDVLEDELGVSA